MMGVLSTPVNQARADASSSHEPPYRPD